MWIFLNDAFFSVVDLRAKRSYRFNPKTKDNDKLVVRARVAGDIEKVFPKSRVFTDAGTDYQFRCIITRGEFKRVMASEIDRINYGNFKDTVDETLRHDAYMSVWSVMNRLQTPKGGRAAKSPYLPDYYGQLFE